MSVAEVILRPVPPLSPQEGSKWRLFAEEAVEE
jgi:hypothetical protein